MLHNLLVFNTLNTFIFIQTMAELTVDNFIRQIKSMNDREKGKLRAMDLIALIIQLPDEQSPVLVDISGKVEALINTVAILDL